MRKLQSGWGSAPDPDGGAYSAPPYPLAGGACPLPLSLSPPRSEILDPPLNRATFSHYSASTTAMVLLNPLPGATTRPLDTQQLPPSQPIIQQLQAFIETMAPALSSEHPSSKPFIQAPQHRLALKICSSRHLGVLIPH